MNVVTKLVSILPTMLALTGCVGESLCDDYKQMPALDQDGNGTTDYRIQVLGDSILAYHNILCKSVGHRIGSELNEQVLTNPSTGAIVSEIQQQYIPPPESGPDYEYVLINGGINDLMASNKPGKPDSPGCDCNNPEQLDHDICVQEVADITVRMENLIDEVQSTSQANVALIAYYPPESEESFIGACFPYVDQLNDRYRQIADLDSTIQVVETYGSGFPIIQKTSPLGRDNYHPTPTGSANIALLTKQQLELQPITPEE